MQVEITFEGRKEDHITWREGLLTAVSVDGELGCNCRFEASLWKSYPNWRFGGTHLVAQ